MVHPNTLWLVQGHKCFRQEHLQQDQIQFRNECQKINKQSQVLKGNEWKKPGSGQKKFPSGAKSYSDLHCVTPACEIGEKTFTPTTIDISTKQEMIAKRDKRLEAALCACRNIPITHHFLV